MIYDTHVHLGKNALANKSAAELLHSMNLAHIDKACVFAGVINDCSNEWLLEEVKPHRDRLIAIGSVSPLLPDQPSLAQLEEWLATGTIAGLKFYVGYEHFYPGDDVLAPYLALLSTFKRPAIFHSGDLYNKAVGAKLKYAHPLAIDDAAVAFPDLPIVIAHMGYPWVTDAAQVCSKNANVYTDLSGLVYESFTERDIARTERLLQTFLEISTPDKLLFGTDWPISDQQNYVESIQRVVGTEIQDLVFHKTAESLFGL